MIRKLGVNTRFDYSALVQGLNDGSLTAAPPKQVPAGLPNTKDLADQILSRKLPAWLQWLIAHALQILIALLIAFVVLAFITGAFILFAVLAVGAIAGYLYTNALKNDDQAVAELLLDPAKQSEAIAAIPAQPNFTLTISDEVNPPSATPTTAGNDSVEAANYRVALNDRVKRMAISVPVEVLQPFNLVNAQAKVSVALDPRVSFPKLISAFVRLPKYIRIDVPERMFPAMAYPDIIDPMYKPLADISQDLLLPNVKLIPPNTISLLKTNQKFIESYLVGLNHEMGHELLWREYPTDERGSYFRQFWDVNGIIHPKSSDEAAALTPAQKAAEQAKLTEAHKDIKPIDTWKRASTLDSHNNRSSTGAKSQVVLVIRGDLLKRYPNTLIFAQKAIPGDPKINPKIDTDLTPAEFDTELMFPLYKGDLPPGHQVLRLRHDRRTGERHRAARPIHRHAGLVLRDSGSSGRATFRNGSRVQPGHRWSFVGRFGVGQVRPGRRDRLYHEGRQTKVRYGFQLAAERQAHVGRRLGEDGVHPFSEAEHGRGARERDAGELDYEASLRPRPCPKITSH